MSQRVLNMLAFVTNYNRKKKGFKVFGCNPHHGSRDARKNSKLGDGE